jgi:hypothetical protein
MVMPVRIGSDDRTARFDPLSVIPACAGTQDFLVYTQPHDEIRLVP